MDINKFNTVDEYMTRVPEGAKKHVAEIRKIINTLAEGREEKISYGVPMISWQGSYLVYFAGYKNHVSLYPVTAGMEKQIPEVGKYRTGKGTLQFKNDEELPVALIKKIIKVRMQENSERKTKYKK